MAEKKNKLRREDLRTFLRVVSYAKPYWHRLLIGGICAVIGGGSVIAMFVTAQNLLGHILDSRQQLGMASEDCVENVCEAAPAAPSPAADAESASDAGAASIPPIDVPGSDFASGIVNKLVSANDAARLERAGFSGMVVLCCMMLVVIVVNSAAVFWSMYLLQWVGQRVVLDLRVGVFKHLQELSLSFYSSSRAGDMISRTVADTQLLQQTVSNLVTDLIRQPVMLVMVLIYVIVTEWKLALFSLLLIPTCVVPIVFIGKRVRRISREGQKRLADLTSVMKETLDGVAVVKSYCQEKREEQRFDNQCREFFRRMVSAAKAKALNDPIAHTIGGLGGIGVMLYAMIAKMPFEQCVLFAGAIWALYEPVKKLGRISMEIQQSSAAADRVFEILDTKVSVSNKPDAKDIDSPLDSLAFDHVSFGYNDQNMVFTDLNLTIPCGQSLAVVGPSGGGKTTIVSLLMRFFDPVSGVIRRNGVDLKDFTLSSLRSRIGLVMQDTFLFNETIAYNISYGKPDATREEIEAAARLAHAHEFIVEKENGYDTIVGDRGVSLSGGQKQRLAIARALIRHPEVLILDEATSALDTESERHVQNAIDDLVGKMTIVIIAHRLSTIAKCDMVAVVANGGIAEYGTQEELLARGGIYTKLHAMQFGGRCTVNSE